jgi:mannan endo-1,4-beta-mannosidase
MVRLTSFVALAVATVSTVACMEPVSPLHSTAKDETADRAEGTNPTNFAVTRWDRVLGVVDDAGTVLRELAPLPSPPSPVEEPPPVVEEPPPVVEEPPPPVVEEPPPVVEDPPPPPPVVEEPPPPPPVVEEPPPPSDVVPRPATVTSTGFFATGGEIYDPSGRKFIMRGMNHTHWFGDQPTNLLAVDEFPSTGANIVRAVFGPDFGVDTPVEKREVVARYVANNMPVMVEDHRGTCDDDPATISEIVDEWTHPDNVSWLNEYEEHVILNIANEWGPSDAGVWSSTYINAIARIRSAGINNMIVVDAGGGCGQDVTSVLTAGQQVIDSDPQRNVAFSIHMYGFWRTSEASDIGSWGDDGSPWSISEEMANVKMAGLPILIGEIAHDDADQVGYVTREALQTLQDLGIGWLAWSWNQNSDETYDLRAGSTAWTYEGPGSLTPGGQMFLLDPEVGMAATSRPATFE